MTNKVKPFYIRITDDMTPQMVQDAFDKCHRLGVRASNNDDTENLFDWFYFGVCARDGTYLSGSEHGYFDAQEITLDQLDGWLELEVEREWKNGDECRYLNSPVKHYFVGLNPLLESYCYIVSDDGCVNYVEVDNLSKPETPEQKAEREKREEAEEMIQCILDNYTNCEESAIEYVIDYLKECESLGR